MQLEELERQYSIAQSLVEQYLHNEKLYETYKHSEYVSAMILDCDGLCDAVIVGLLHDIVEDSTCTIDIIKEYGISDYIADAIDAITRRENEDYFTYIKRVSKNSLAKYVKIFDLRHNMDLSRVDDLTPYIIKRSYKYFYSIKYLQGLITYDQYAQKVKSFKI